MKLTPPCIEYIHCLLLRIPCLAKYLSDDSRDSGEAYSATINSEIENREKGKREKEIKRGERERDEKEREKEIKRREREKEIKKRRERDKKEKVSFKRETERI